MGTGKSSWAIKYINDNPDKKFLCVVPLLEECDRYRKFAGVKTIGANKFGVKWDDFHELIYQDCNVVITDSMVINIDMETMELLHAKNYNVIIDESLTVIAKHKLTKDDNDILFHQNLVSLDEEGYLQWDADHENYNGKFSVTKERCLSKTLMGFKNEDGESMKTVMWNFPKIFFECFEKSYILTYMWNGNLGQAYFDIHNIPYIKKMIGNDKTLIPYDPELELAKRKGVAKLITIYEGKLNAIGEKIGKTNPLSKTWYKDRLKRNPAMIEQLCRNTENFFRSYSKTKSADNMYTTFKFCRKKVKGAGFTKGFVACNIRNTNNYSDKKSLAYLINFFLPPEIKRFVNYYNFHFNEDVYALSALLQWIGRSQIRNGKPVVLYVPSERMRTLLKNWIDECSNT